jgi:hypothetical protein
LSHAAGAKSECAAHSDLFKEHLISLTPTQPDTPFSGMRPTKAECAKWFKGTQVSLETLDDIDKYVLDFLAKIGAS